MMDEPTSVRYVHPAYFDHAPRFHSGIGPDEMPAIIRRDEAVFTPGQMRALGAGAGGGTNVQVNVVNNTGAQVQTRSERKGNVDVRTIVIGHVKDEFNRGGFDAQLRARTGTQVQPRGR
jgi:hypothetical protein